MTSAGCTTDRLPLWQDGPSRGCKRSLAQDVYQVKRCGRHSARASQLRQEKADVSRGVYFAQPVHNVAICSCFLLSLAAAPAAVPVEPNCLCICSCTWRSLLCLWFLALPGNLVQIVTFRCWQQLHQHLSFKATPLLLQKLIRPYEGTESLVATSQIKQATAARNIHQPLLLAMLPNLQAPLQR